MKAFFSPYPRVDRSDKARRIKVTQTSKVTSIFEPVKEWTTELLEGLDRKLEELIEEGDVQEIVKLLEKYWPTFFSWPDIYKYRHAKLREIGQEKSSANTVTSFSNVIFAMETWLNGMDLSNRRPSNFDKRLFLRGISLIGNRIYNEMKELNEEQILNISRTVRGKWSREILSSFNVDPKEARGIIYRIFIMSALYAAVTNYDVLQEKEVENLLVPPSLDNVSLSVPINGLLKPGILQRSVILSERIYTLPDMDVPKRDTTIESIEERHRATSDVFSAYKDRLDYFSNILEGSTPLQTPVEPWWFDFRSVETGVGVLEQGPRIRLEERITDEEIEEVTRALIRTIYKTADADAPIKALEPHAQYERVSFMTAPVTPITPVTMTPGTPERRVTRGPIDKRRFSMRFLEAFPGYTEALDNFTTIVRGYSQYQSDMMRYLSARTVDALGPYPYEMRLKKDREALKKAHRKMTEWIIEKTKQYKGDKMKIITLQEMFINMNGMYSSVLREQPPKLNPVALGVLYHSI